MKLNSKKKHVLKKVEYKMFYPTGNITFSLNLSKRRFHQCSNGLSVNGSPDSVMLAVEILII